jgi:hypothetical protein
MKIPEGRTGPSVENDNPEMAEGPLLAHKQKHAVKAWT